MYMYMNTNTNMLLPSYHRVITTVSVSPCRITGAVACGAFKGVDLQHRLVAAAELHRALRVIEQVGGLPR